MKKVTEKKGFMVISGSGENLVKCGNMVIRSIKHAYILGNTQHVL